MLAPTTIAEVQEAVREARRVRPKGGGTKPALSRDATLDLTKLAGVTEYEPSEYIVTALAGTRLRDLRSVLDSHGQYLPFDPPFVDAGATLGGMVASGLNGPGAFRFGGLRDFILAARFVDGRGRLLTGGAKVVKNAAGFDLPKFLVGSAGRWGVLTEVSFKVFPRPPASASFRIVRSSAKDAIERMSALAGGPWECDALEWDPGLGAVLGRIRGHEESLDRRLERMRAAGHDALEKMTEEEARAYWNARREFAWASESLIKLPLTPRQIADCEAALPPSAKRVYGMAGNVAWLSGEGVREAVARLGGRVLAVRGEPLEFTDEQPAYMARLRRVFDPEGKFR